MYASAIGLDIWCVCISGPLVGADISSLEVVRYGTNDLDLFYLEHINHM